MQKSRSDEGEQLWLERSDFQTSMKDMYQPCCYESARLDRFTTWCAVNLRNKYIGRGPISRTFTEGQGNQTVHCRSTYLGCL